MEDLMLQVGNFATAAAANSFSVVGNFIVVLALTGLLIMFSYRSRGGIVSLAVAIYMGYAIYLVFPYTQTIVSSGSSPLMQAIISVTIYLVSCIVPFIFIERLATGGFGVLSVFPRFGLSFLVATFLIALAYHVFHVSHIYTFPEPMNTLFAPDQYFFWWFVAPLIGLMILVH